MRTLSKIFILLVFALAGFGALVADSPALAEEKPSYAHLPPVGGLMVRQLGSDSILVELKGTSLPLPEVDTLGTDVVTFTLAGAYLPAVKWERDFNLPLVSLVRADQDGEKVVFKMRVSSPMSLKTMEGKAPSNRYVLRLSTAGFVERENIQADLLKPQAPVAATAGDPFSKTLPVTLDLRDVELRDVFRMLGAYANMNIVADPSVPNTLVTMTLKGVPLNEAMGYLMRMYNMSYAIMGKTIIVGTPDSIGKTTGKESTRQYRIAYADMKAVGGLVQGLAGVNKVVIDERLRTLYVTGRPEQFLEVEKVLQQVDHPGRQVMLQARIIEVTDSGKEELETIIDAVYNQWWFNYSSAGAGAGYVYADQPANYNPQTGDNRPAPLAPITGSGLKNIAEGSLTKLLDFGLRALVTKNKGKVLADPSIITIDGKKAVIKLVENYPYISERDEAGNPTWSEKEVGPILEFTPTVGRDKMVSIDLKIETGEIIGTYRGQAGEQFPQTTNREVTTNIRVRDGEPFVVGGLYKDQEKVEKHRVPLLSDIPLLGELFKYKSETRDKTEVAMIVIPYILDIPDTTVEKLVLK
ncbi:MAG: type II secretion system protein GspD [Aminobacteriaceae bacterium]|jgi:type IV pilus assembly protein PilQ|uniref:type II secretion system protein GspD n=1 Tax=Aminivibrio sp. TaxID=1872489 RepID=UPI002B209618|nr:secretion protein [Aminivibrio sp.]MEA4951365.1 secretion protein [Aminivibrio sp.]